MIDLTEFENEIKSFYRYKNKKINEDIILFWHSKLKRADIFSLRKTFDSFKYSNIFPDLSEVQKKCFEIKNRSDMEKYNFNKKMKCEFCEDVGFVFYNKKKHGHTYEFIARCRCEAGQREMKECMFIEEIIPDYYTSDKWGKVITGFTMEAEG